MITLTETTDQVRKCPACGEYLPATARFCEQCGQAVPSISPLPQATPQSESLISHIGVRLKAAGKGLFGQDKYSDYELLITNQRLLFLSSGSCGDERWFQEQNNLDFDTLMVDEEFAQWRSIIEQYDFAKPLWNDYYSTPFEELLAANKHNFAVKINDLVLASIKLDNDDIDTLNLSCVDGTQYHCLIYLLLGNATYRALSQVLDSSQLKLVNT